MSIPGVPEPVSIYPPATSKSLEEWLNMARGASATERSSRLDDIASNRAVDVAAASGSIAGGITLILFGIYWSLFAMIFVPITVFTVLGAALILLGVFGVHRARTRLPKDDKMRVVRGPGNAVGGIVAATAIWGIVAVITIPSWLSSPSQVEGLDVMMIGFLLFFALLLVTCFIVPAVVLGRASASLRRICAASPHYRALLDQHRLTWRPRYGDQMFGPL